MRQPFPLDTDAEFQHVLRGYGLALLLVALSHGALWFWSQRKPIETPAIVPPMVDVELIAPPEKPPKPAPPATALPSPPSSPPPKAKPLPKPKPAPPPLTKAEVAPQAPSNKEPLAKPKKAEPAPREKEPDDLAKQLRELRESLAAKSAQPAAREGASPVPAAPSRSANAPGTTPNRTPSDQKVTGAHDAAYLHNPKPRYPAIAIARNWEGVVKLRVNVLPSGSAGQVLLAQSSGHDALDEAALEVVKRWRFVPAKRGDTPIASWVQVPLVFKLAAAR